MSTIMKRGHAMNNRSRLILKLTLATYLLSLITSCGGTGSDFQVANGVGGTGITMGKITGFGSIHVNGIKFNTDTATFTRDRVGSKAQSDFHTGEIVRVIGNIDKNTQTGIATEVIFSDILEGSVTSVAVKNTIKILEQNIITDQLTLFHGFNKLSDLKLGNIVEVSGFSNAQGDVKATSLTLIEGSFTDGVFLGVEGIVSSLNKEKNTFKINNLTINYTSALFENVSVGSLENGLFLFVDANQDISNGIMIASNIFVLSDDLNTGDIIEIEGLVSRFVSSTNFDIEEFPVTTTVQTRYKNGKASDLGLDNFMRISGKVNAQGVIVADEITLLDLGVDATSDIIIEANVEAIDLTNKTVTILGHTIKVDLFTLLSDETTENFVALNLSQLVVGDSVFIVATPTVDGTEEVLIASRLSKIETISSIFLSAIIQNSDEQLTTLKLLGHTIITDNFTLYQNEDGEDITAATFFSLITDGESLINVSGNLLPDGSIQADFVDVVF